MLTVRDLAFYKGIRTGGADLRDIDLSPLADTDFANLPPTVIVTAECDPLSSDGEAYRTASSPRAARLRGSRKRASCIAICAAGTAWPSARKFLPASSKR